ncbi:RHS repeat domain-containing protein, partial [Streptomyces rochei]|uniref:RHS repeat domain-containing protein n=1 Tax=Streptomyces rochei TaxID=1928 RepID=UPI0036FDC5CA
TWRYEWDAEDRLKAVVTPDGTRWRYTYDPLGRRTAKLRLAADGETVVEGVDFTWDGTNLCEQTTTSPQLPNPVTLTWDHQGLRPIAQTERITAADAPQAEIDSRFFAIVTDLVGTPSELIDEQGEIAWHTRSTLWGTTAWATDSTTYIPLRFPGQYYDPETGLHYNYFRHYDPETGRYLTSDPLGLATAPNSSTYVHNPLISSDHLGLSPDACPIDTSPSGASDKNTKIPVIGTLDDTMIALNWEGHEILYSKTWSPEMNRAWIQRIITDRRDVYLASPQTDNLLFDEFGDPTVFSQELEQLRDAGYVQRGDYMIAPKNNG